MNPVRHGFRGEAGYGCRAMVPGEDGVFGPCGLPSESPAHHVEREPVTVVMQTPVVEAVPVPVIPGPVLDVPAEDGGEGGAWSVDDTVRMALGSGPVFVEREIGPGPWPMRQFRLTALGFSVVHDLIDGLWLAGIPFDVYCWWLGTERMVRVVWGEFLGLDSEEIAVRMEPWLTS